MEQSKNTPPDCTALLTKDDIAIIRREMRMPVIFAIMITLLGTFALIGVYYTLKPESALNYIMLEVLFVMLALLLKNTMNRKYQRDLERGKKVIKMATVQRKEMRRTSEAGSGSLATYEKVEVIFDPRLIIEGYSQMVSPEVYSAVNAGEMVEMHYTMHSNYLIDIKAPPKPED